MQTNMIVKRGKNLLIYLPNGELPNVLFQAINNHFKENKILITEFSIIYELILTSENFSVTSKSIYTSLGISDKTLKSKLDNLKESGILFSFQFSTGKNESKVFYILNLSGMHLTELTVYYDLMEYFPSFLNKSIITQKIKKENQIDDRHKKLINQLFDLYNQNKEYNFELNKKVEIYFKDKIHERIRPFLAELETFNETEITEFYCKIRDKKLI